MLQAPVYKGQPTEKKRWVYLKSDSAISAGYGVCYDRDRTLVAGGLAFPASVAADLDAGRDWIVQVPDNTNNMAFAGVAVQDYTAVTGGQMIQIYEPGSVCPLYVDATVTFSQNKFATCQIGGAGGSGTFNVTVIGELSRGSARILSSRSGAGLVLAELLDGKDSGLVESVTPTAGAITFMVGGVSVILIATLASAATVTLADGTYAGQRKTFIQTGTLTTNGVAITVTTGQQLGVTTALATITFSAGAGTKFQSLIWNGRTWVTESYSATSPTQA